MVRAVEGIKQKLASQGQEIEDRKLMQAFVLPHFESAFKQLQETILAESDVDENDLEDAVTTYVKQGDKKLADICERIRMIYREFGGEVDIDEEVSAPSQNLSLDTIILILEGIGEKMNEQTSEFIEAYKEDFGLPSSRADMERFQNELMTLSERL
jgi:hypothetical protein